MCVIHYGSQCRKVPRIGKFIKTNNVVFRMALQHMEDKITSNKSCAACYNDFHVSRPFSYPEGIFLRPLLIDTDHRGSCHTYGRSQEGYLCNPAFSISNIFECRNLDTCTRFNGFYEIGRVTETRHSSRIKPSIAPAKGNNIQLPLFQIDLLRSVISSSPRADGFTCFAYSQTLFP